MSKIKITSVQTSYTRQEPISIESYLDDSEEETKKNIEAIDAIDIEEEIVSIFNLIRDNYYLITQRNYEELNLSSLDIDSVIKKLESIKLNRETEKNNKCNLLKDEEHVSIKNKINNLRTKKFICSNTDLIKEKIDSIRFHENIEKAKSYANSQAITKKGNELANELLSGDYINRFNIELKKLTKGTVSVELRQQRGGKGNTI